MSEQEDQRAALVAALGGISADVAGETVYVTASPVKPAPVVAYQAWPTWLATRPTAMCVSERDWQVTLALPGADAQTWTESGDALMDAVADALSAWHLTRVEPAQLLVADNANIPILLYTLDI